MFKVTGVYASSFEHLTELSITDNKKLQTRLFTCVLGCVFVGEGMLDVNIDQVTPHQSKITCAVEKGSFRWISKSEQYYTITQNLSKS